MIIIKLHDLVRKKKIKGYELASATGLSAVTISKIMKGENVNIRLTTVDKLCKYFDCAIEDLLEYKIES